jgi:multidrug efflux system membrane fusion protein
MSSTQISPPVTPTPNAALTPPEPKKSHVVRNIVLLLFVVLIGFFVWRIATARGKSQADAAAKQAAAANRAVPVQVATVQQRPMPIYVTGLGSVTPYYTVTLKARVTGELMRVNFKEGQEVKIGQELMTIDPRPYQAVVDQAKGQLARDQAQLVNNQAEFNRYKALYNEGVVSKEQLDTYASNLGQFEGAIKSDQANIDAGQLNVTYCHITSPIDGRVGLRLVDPGNVITANTTNLIVINQFLPIAVNFTLPEDQLQSVLSKLQAEKQLRVEAFDRSDTQHIASGQLLTADNQIDPTTGTGKLKSVFPNKDELLFPNQFVNIHLILEQRPDAITMPSAAVQHGTQGDYVWLVKLDHTVAMQPVKIELVEGNVAILADGAKAGDSVVTDGADKLRNGMPVDPRQQNQIRPGQGHAPKNQNGTMGQ